MTYTSRPPASRSTRIARRLLAMLAAATFIHAQQPVFNRNVIVLDPAHGGSDSGARIADSLAEKQLTLSIATRLKPLLTAAGFTVVTTRDADPADVISPDQRAGTANHARALACLLIHATPSGSGVHLFTSSLPAVEASPDATLPWDSAQGPYIPLSLRLANELGVSLLHAGIPPLLGHASIRPIDNLTCPAVALEIAPLNPQGESQTALSDTTYQQHTVQAIADALLSWRNHAAPIATPAPKPATPPAATKPATPAPAATAPAKIKPAKPATPPAVTPPPAATTPVDPAPAGAPR